MIVTCLLVRSRIIPLESAHLRSTRKPKGAEHGRADASQTNFQVGRRTLTGHYPLLFSIYPAETVARFLYSFLTVGGSFPLDDANIDGKFSTARSIHRHIQVAESQFYPS